MTNKLTKKEFNDKVFELFERSNYKEYFDYRYQEQKYLQNKYKEKFGIELPFSKIGDETMEKLGIDVKKWDKITAEIWRKEKEKGLLEITREIGGFVHSARILGFSFDFDDVGEEVEIVAGRIANYLLSD